MDEVIKLFNANGVRYLLIGGQAMRLEGMPRFSMDWDFFIPADDPSNFDGINRLLSDCLDLPLIPIGPKGQNLIQTYQTQWGVLQFHLKVPGLISFADAEKKKVIRQTEDGTPVHCICGDDLLTAKEKAGRPQDKEDILFLVEKKKRGRE